MPSLSFFLGLAALAGVANAECPNACSGHGECGVFDQCSCFRNWQGNDCSERTCPFGHAHVDSPKGDLNMDGGTLSGPSDPVVINSEVYPLGTTEQYPDAQANEAHFYMECSNKGLCDRKSGECECFDGYDGTSCQRASCPGGIGGDSEQCSGHGTCHSIGYLSHHFSEAKLPLSHSDQVRYNLWDAGYTRGCHCDAPFSGADCAARDCKYGVDPLYVSTGAPLYQTALVVNSCLANGAGDGTFSGSGATTTNGMVHNYDAAVYTATGGFLPDTGVAYDGTMILDDTTTALDDGTIPQWAVPGAEIIAYVTDSGTGCTGSYCIGTRQRIVAVENVADVVTLYLVDSETQATENPQGTDLSTYKVEASDSLVEAATYSVAHVVNTFTLLFTDHHGEVYRTAPISAAVADYSAEVKAALEGLPNNVVSEVNVNAEMVNPYTDTSTEMGYKIEFTQNPGQLGALEIDSTPIRLGQTLQAGIECEKDTEFVYSKVGYYEIGEDVTTFGAQVGSITHFQNQAVTDDATSPLSGEENSIVYTNTDLSSTVGTLIKIQDEVYAVLSGTAEFLELNTHFKGDSVTGTSVAITTNDGDGLPIADSTFDVTFTTDTFTFEEQYTAPTHIADGSDEFTEKTTNFEANDQIRMVYTDASNFAFDCLFTVVSSTSTIADDTLNSALLSVVVTEDSADNCPTFAYASALSAGVLTAVELYAFTPSAAKVNGVYTDDRRIFGSSHTFDTANDVYTSDVNRKGNYEVDVVETPGSGKLEANSIVLFENEFNVVDSCTASACTFKNAMTTGNVGWDTIAATNAGEDPSLITTMVGHDTQLLIEVVLDATTTGYEYVSQCSNRGLCDSGSGLCKCFKGYTGDNCDTISELYA
jgi:hypothetical protein